MVKKKFIIYRLFDKRSPETTYYVGLTTNFPQRIAQHLLYDGQNPGKDAWIRTPGVEMGGEVLATKWEWQEARLCEAYWINHYREMGMPLTNQLIPALVPSTKRKRPHFKTWKMGLPEDSPAYQDLLEYGHEMGMQPAETARVVIVEWSRALRGRIAIGGGVMPHFPSKPEVPVAPAAKPKESEERERARGARFAGTFALDDDD